MQRTIFALLFFLSFAPALHAQQLEVTGDLPESPVETAPSDIWGAAKAGD